MTSLTKVLTGVCGILFISLLLPLHLYSGVKDNYQLLSSQFSEQVVINKDYKFRIQPLYEPDDIYTQELTDAKAEIDQLRDAADRNPERMYIRANCPKASSVTASGMDDTVTDLMTPLSTPSDST